MSKPILGCDVDICICPSDIGWNDYLKYFNGFAKVVEREDGMLPYDLSQRYPSVADPYQYWRNLDYSQFEPLEGSVEVLQDLSKDFDIVFISQMKGTHAKSKYYWLDHHFPFKKGVILTKEKYLMNNSVAAMIDDRLEHLNGFDKNKRILFETIYTQSVQCYTQYQFSAWEAAVAEHIREICL